MNHVGDVRHEVNNDVLSELMREGEDRRASEQRQRELRHEQKSVRWRLFGATVMFLTRLVVDLCRRGHQCVQHSMLRCILCSSIGGSSSRHALRSVLLKDERAAPIAGYGAGVCTVLHCGIIGLIPIGRQSRLNANELNEDKIRSRIIVDRARAFVPEMRQVFRREQTDGLKLGRSESGCENTVQGMEILTDSMVCTRSQLDKARCGCCNSIDTSLPRIQQYTGDRCDTDPPHCCNVFEQCVSCCMHPLNSATRRELLTHADPTHPIYSEPAAITVFQYCQYRCRTSSASVQHQNSYRSHRLFCYGIHRPLKVLPTFNSDGLHDDWSTAASREEARENLLPTAQLELDPYYQKYESRDQVSGHRTNESTLRARRETKQLHVALQPNVSFPATFLHCCHTKGLTKRSEALTCARWSTVRLCGQFGSNDSQRRPIVACMYYPNFSLLID
ncbi:unnamed protein product [Hyaloperonospora brassicae]|uniref:SREBP regulating gene protein n=1 Tax=Hyaloperonospora brassicae TaxID=162125 RepID=A0AAV0UJV4_HYABA|nr:unnamed protein product [Hyaloperonospora brassicae]